MNCLFPVLFATAKRSNRRLIARPTGKRSNPSKSLLLNLSLWLLPAVLTATPTVAAEKIYASYAVLERSISISALEAFAKEGQIDEDLAVYAQYVPPEQLEQLREILLTRADITPVTISQFLYTQQGETLLKRLGQVIKTGSRREGKFAIRSALILAAADPEGLTLLNVLRKFPTESIRIDLQSVQRIARQLQQAINQTNQAIALVDGLSTTEAASQPGFGGIPVAVDPGSSEFPVALGGQLDLWRTGPFTSEVKSIEITIRNAQIPTALTDERIFPVDIYLPQQATRQAAPVIVISHGLGSDRKTFQYLAQHLASYGFAVAVPQHPGSDARQLQALLSGTASDVAEPKEFVYRPLDVKYLLDTLTQLEQTDPQLQGRLNLQQVGVLGQSFGGYTSLALAGAPINFNQLRQDCPNSFDSWNISLLLQCRAAELPDAVQYDLSDERVKAVIAINPINSSTLGRESLSQIQVPVMLVAGSADTAAPALPEQIQPFTWLTTPEKYLVVMNGGTHFSTLVEADGGGGVVPIPSDVIGPTPGQARRYISALSLAFFKTHIAGDPQYRPYLRASYAEAISREPLSLSLIESLTETQLNEALNRR
ncbi:alpha/beta hydrolase [Microcoleus sp. FACHB-68]|uniref:alpha/beta hydrolase n=1 Tax=Microcoleus sp. FACHB-68 TaxID=2692826 RepID=UPI0016852B39|nr:alpha/beta hydrolase [Microcoleus sp. FACHB-68]MBD1937957.1 alpha/beta hydrolase [Microcoleus sp. FACHB-68]